MKLYWKFILKIVLVLGTAASVMVGTLLLNPGIVDEPEPPAPLTRQEILHTNADPGRLAPGIPEGVPEYILTDFNYISTEKGVPQWKVHARRAQVYQRDLVHAHTIKAQLYGTDGRITLVHGKEAKYRMNDRNLEVFGDVHTVFPDGFIVDSQYLLYKPDTRWISIPRNFLVEGTEEDLKKPQWISFTSQGVEFDLKKAIIELPSQAVVSFFQQKPEGIHETRISSDRALIERRKQLAHFSMESRRPLAKRFVEVLQPRMAARSRRAELRYGADAEALEYMILYDDVLTKETGLDESVRYATSGQASFHSKKNIIVLNEFPQVYQGSDTLTGEEITLHRDTDVVEVSHSNAFSTGENSKSDADRN